MRSKTKEGYTEAFLEECGNSYLEIDQMESRLGFAINRLTLETMAFSLACPVKVNPPSWQHGRVLYAICRSMLDAYSEGVLLDIGTAKGFSACVMAMAIADAEVADNVRVVSVDVIDPDARVLRNSITELDGPLTVPEFTEKFIPVGVRVEFYGGGSLDTIKNLMGASTRVPVAFVDGKHRYYEVHKEASMIREMQDSGDYIVFDDIQIPEVAGAVRDLTGYRVGYVSAGENRKYAIAKRI